MGSEALARAIGEGQQYHLPRERPLPLLRRSLSFVGVDNLRDVCHGVGAAHDGQVDAERHLRGRMPQPLRYHVQRDPRGGQPMTGRTVPEAMGPSPLASGTGRLLVKVGMLDAGTQMPQGRLPGQTDNEIPWAIGRGPVDEQAGQVRVKWHGPAPAALAAADQ